MLFLSFFVGALNVWAEEELALTVTAKVSIYMELEVMPGHLPYRLDAEIITPENRKGQKAPGIYFQDLDDLKKTGVDIDARDVISFRAPNDFFKRTKGKILRLSELKDIKMVRKCPPGELPKPIFKPPQNKQSVQEKDKGSTASKEAGPLPPPPGWPTGSKPKEAPPAKNTDATESKPANKEPAGK